MPRRQRQSSIASDRICTPPSTRDASGATRLRCKPQGKQIPSPWICSWLCSVYFTLSPYPPPSPHLPLAPHIVHIMDADLAHPSAPGACSRPRLHHRPTVTPTWTPLRSKAPATPLLHVPPSTSTVRVPPVRTLATRWQPLAWRGQQSTSIRKR